MRDGKGGELVDVIAPPTLIWCVFVFFVLAFVMAYTPVGVSWLAGMPAEKKTRPKERFCIVERACVRQTNS